MKKLRQLFGFAFFLFLASTTSVFAKEMTLTELGNEAISLEPNTNYIYVIGNYAFTSEHTLTTQDVMMAARTIKIENEEQINDIKSIYEKMAIYVLRPEYDDNYDYIIDWNCTSNILNEGDSCDLLSDKVDIEYIEDTKLKYHAESEGSEYNVVTIEDLDEVEKDILTNEWNFNLNLNTISKNDEGSLEGVLREQHLTEGVFKDSNGYFTLLKIAFPTGDKTLNYYKDKWTIILNTEDESTKEITPSKEDYENGYITVLFKVGEEQKEITYQIDYDGSKGDSFLPHKETINTDFTFKTENKITFEDGNGEVLAEEIIYEGDQITESDQIPSIDYHELKYWTKKGENTTKYEFDAVSEKNEDITLVAHWELDVDSFVEDVIDDLNSKDTTNSKYFGEEFVLNKKEKNIVIEVLKENVSLNELYETSLPGAIAYVLQKGEILAITLNSGEKSTTLDASSMVLTKLDDQGESLKEQIKEKIKQFFEEVLGDQEQAKNKKLDQMTDTHFTLKIGDTSNFIEDIDAIYTFSFESKIDVE